ncbi:cystathionine gamma-lyase [Tunturibacter empetritectus]|uniref:Cystathionine gamma-lyase n=1 Tax=Tunturiibacter empetritectus TaxID=3069691 RepID=A0A7W8MT77_9BACT|nr:cystathionine gamma-lyase [Edaphobacter lichenicola]MBB5319152.1 cystathionine gamma-lyase [Edaphobacter lichenicola]
MRDSTKIIRSTLSRTVPGEPLHAGPVFAAPYHTPGDPADTPYTYARSHNPTWTALERAIGQMESGQLATGESYPATALVFASGMAACAAVFGAVLRPGDVVVLPSNAYYTARVLLQEYFAPMGITLRMAPTAGNAQAELLDGARLLWLESPSNPGMEICDIALLSEAAHRAGALVAVDNTTPTPLGQLPLALGADFSVASDTKSMTGHSDLLLGHVAVRDLEFRAKIDQWRTLTGAALGPMEAWLALRSIATLPLRLERSCENAQRIAEFLASRKEVTGVFYPGLPSHPGHAIAKKQMRYFGPVLSFVLQNKKSADTFLSKSILLTDATSFGGVTTTAERRAKWGGDAVPDGFIRMSAGCEAIEDLLEDIAQALDATQ